MKLKTTLRDIGTTLVSTCRTTRRRKPEYFSIKQSNLTAHVHGTAKTNRCILSTVWITSHVDSRLDGDPIVVLYYKADWATGQKQSSSLESNSSGNVGFIVVTSKVLCSRYFFGEFSSHISHTSFELFSFSLNPLISIYLFVYLCMEEPGWRSRYIDWLRAGRPRGQSSSPGRIKNFLFCNRPDRLWGPPNLLSDGYRGLFPRG
jgi:hypothetical protein